MPAKPKTYEWYVDHHFNHYLTLKQFKDGLNAKPPTITREELMQKARARALTSVANDQMLATRNAVDKDADLRDDAEYREQRIDEYEKAYGNWDDAGDKALLFSLVELETQQRAILRDLSRANTVRDKSDYWTALRQNTDAQKNLQVTLGIDKKSRENARITGNPMDNWQEVKDEIADWVDQLAEEFIAEAKEVKNEEDLKDLMKYKLSWPLAVIDSVVYNVKRVNGMGTVQEDND